MRHIGRRSLAISISVVLVVGGCGAPAASTMTSTGSATAPAASAAGSSAPSATPGAAGVAPEVLEALADPTPQRLGAVGEELEASIDEASGLVAAVGPGVVGWLTDHRSSTIRSALGDAGLDTTPYETARFSTDPVAADDLTAFGEAYIGAVIIAPVLLDAGMNRIGETGSRDLEPRTSTDRRTEGNLLTESTVTMRSSLSVSGRVVTGEADMTQVSTTTDTTSGAVVSTANAHVRVRGRIDACPDIDGVVSLRLEYTMSSSQSGGTGGGFDLEATAEIRGTVGEDAFLQGERHVQDGSFTVTGADGTRSRGSGQRTVVTSNQPGSARFGAVVAADEATDPGTMSDAEVSQWQNAVQMTTVITSSLAMSKAQDLWRSGKCVRIEATEQSRKVKASEQITFTAKPVSEVDGSDINKKVDIAFSGVRSVTPVNVAEDPPVSLTFVAGPNVDDQGTVKLKSTSNRGIGMLDLTFTVEGGWFHTSSGGGAAVHGQKCGGIGGDWVLDGTYEKRDARGVARGKDRWVITINEATLSGTYTYRDDQKLDTGPLVVTTVGQAKGDATLTREDKGRVSMRLRDTQHSFRATTNLGGQGKDTPLPLRLEIIFWEPGGDC